MNQLLVFGHRPSQQTREFLDKNFGTTRVVNAHLNSPMIADIDVAVESLFYRLYKDNVDFSGATPTFITCAGMSTAATLALAALFGALGAWPKIVNTMRWTDDDGRDVWIPCPENPILDCGASFEVGRKYRRCPVDVEYRVEPQALAA